MTVYLLRHARAGRRSAWHGDDQLRPLTKPGRTQADAIADELQDCGITRIVSSPYVRSRQSVEPLAQRLLLPVDLAPGLAEGSALHDVLRVVEKVLDEHTVLCTHGDVMELLLDHLRSTGVRLKPGRAEPPMAKGSFWELEAKAGEIVKAIYRPAPTRPTK